MTKYSSYILFLLVSILVVILNINGVGPVDSLQRSLDDLLCRVTAPEGPRPNIVLVTIDGRAQDQFGAWPWNRDLIADLTAATAHGDPAAIVLDLKLPENSQQDSAGFTDILAEQLSWVKNAVLGYDIALATFRSNRTSNPDKLFENSVTIDNPLGVMNEQSSLLARKVFLPAEKLLLDKPFLGFDYDAPDEDRVLRHEPVLVNYEGYYYPSQAFLAAAVYLNVPPDQIKVKEGKEVLIGKERRIPINERGEFFIRFNKQPAFVRYSAADILSDSFNRTQLKGKLVLIGVDDYAQTESFRTPVDKDITPLQIKASVAENIINNNIVSVSEQASLWSLITLLLLGGVCAFVMPRLNLGFRLLVPLGLLFILANVNYFTLTTFSVLPQTMYIALELILFALVSPLLDMQVLTMLRPEEATSLKPKPTREKAKPKVKAEAFQEPPIREIRASSSDPENQPTTAVDYRDEKISAPSEGGGTQAVEKNQMVDHQTLDLDDDQAPVKGTEAADSEHFDHQAVTLEDETTERKEETRRKPTIISPDAGPSNDSHDVTDSDRVRISQSGGISHLGRYQVESVLGKGAMGLVYKGIDPAINRPVALKTIRLDFVNDPDEMAELKERLHREAQAAGKLSHPNIVTIYDVGSEGHLQYIAMEYLEGQTLEQLIKKQVKFNYRIIAQIIQQICAALDYAHERGIVHRDIKPANIMVLKDYRVKVMDYGIARIDSNSMTKTGIAMGTPNYISPEQLKGQTVDKRADLFSLGVVMYEMLLGQRPFRGDNITQLIYAITTKEPPKPSDIQPEVPLLFDHIIARALRKDPGERYQKASEISADLADFVASFAVR